MKENNCILFITFFDSTYNLVLPLIEERKKNGDGIHSFISDINIVIDKIKVNNRNGNVKIGIRDQILYFRTNISIKNNMNKVTNIIFQEKLQTNFDQKYCNYKYPLKIILLDCVYN